MVKLSISGILGIIFLLLLAGCSQGDLAGEAYYGKFKRLPSNDEDPSDGGSDGGGGGGSVSFWVPGEQGGRRHITFLLNPGIKFKEAVDTNDQDVWFTNVEMDSLHVEENVEIEGNLIIEDSDNEYGAKEIRSNKYCSLGDYPSDDGENCFKLVVNLNDVSTWTLDSNLNVVGDIETLDGNEIRSERFCDGSGNNCLEINSDSPPFNQWAVDSSLNLAGNLNVRGTLLAEGNIDIEGDLVVEEGYLQIGNLDNFDSIFPAPVLNADESAGYACIDGEGTIFRSNNPCHESIG